MEVKNGRVKIGVVKRVLMGDLHICTIQICKFGNRLNGGRNSVASDSSNEYSQILLYFVYF